MQNQTIIKKPKSHLYIIAKHLIHFFSMFETLEKKSHHLQRFKEGDIFKDSGSLGLSIGFYAMFLILNKRP